MWTKIILSWTMDRSSFLFSLNIHLFKLEVTYLSWMVNYLAKYLAPELLPRSFLICSTRRNSFSFFVSHPWNKIKKIVSYRFFWRYTNYLYTILSLGQFFTWISLLFLSLICKFCKILFQQIFQFELFDSLLFYKIYSYKLLKVRESFGA